jgi:hypothetical protein
VAGRVRDLGIDTAGLARPFLTPRNLPSRGRDVQTERLGGADEFGILTPIPAPLSLGQSAPNPVVDRLLKRVNETLAPNRAAATDPLCFLVLERAG